MLIFVTECDVTIGPEDSASNVLSTSGDGGIPQPLQTRPAAPTPQPERVGGGQQATAPIPRKRASVRQLMSVDKGDGQYEEVHRVVEGSEKVSTTFTAKSEFEFCVV